MDRGQWKGLRAPEVVTNWVSGFSINNWTLGQKRKSESHDNTSEVRLLLLGKSRSGKSVTGNTILGHHAFTSKFSEQPVTTQCETASTTRGQSKVVVIDTPALFSSQLRAEDRCRDLDHCLQLCVPSIHALLLVIPIGHFKAEDTDAIKGILETFGDESRKLTLIVFTRKDELGGDTLQDYIEHDPSLKESVQTYGGRYCAFNNKAGAEEREAQVRELLDKVQRLVRANRGPHRLQLRHGARGQQEGVPQTGGNPHGPGERQLQFAGCKPNPEMSELKVLLVGKRGAGKSTAGNRLLGKRVFETKFSDVPVTRDFHSESRVWKGRKVSIIDAPDISSGDFESKLVRHSVPGPHVFLMVTPLDSFSEQDEAVLNILGRCYGGMFAEHMIVLLTRKEDLEDSDLGEESVQRFLINEHRGLSKYLRWCRNRYQVFTYKAVGEEEQRLVEELLEKIVNLVEQNGNRPCVSRAETLNIVLVGRSGTGKSAAGNTILGKKEFTSELRAQPVTKTSESATGSWRGQEVVVVDTPSLLGMPGEGEHRSTLREEAEHILSLCKRGNTVMVLVLQLGRFTQMEEKCMQVLRAIFGKEVDKHTIVLFTRKEDLGSEKIEDYAKNTDNKALRKIIEKCEGRVCTFNNKETGEAREAQVEELLTMASKLIERNGGYVSR